MHHVTGEQQEGCIFVRVAHADPRGLISMDEYPEI